MLNRLCYVSTRVENDHDLIEDLSNILLTARSFNRTHHIYGVLYYSDGTFFQCLEGEQSILNALYEHIAKDKRHHHILRFQDQQIEQLKFSKWSMKYVKDSTKISRFFAKLGLAKFEPYALNDKSLADFVQLLLKIDNAEPMSKS